MHVCDTYSHNDEIASFPVSTPQLYFATLRFSYCKRQQLEWRPGNEANDEMSCDMFSGTSQVILLTSIECTELQLL